MRVAVLGGTRFIGRAIVRELSSRGHTVRVVHRGEHPLRGLPGVERRHADRASVTEIREALAGFRPDTLVDTRALTRRDAEIVLAATPRRLRLVLLSSMDVYRAYGSLLANRFTDAVPIDESGPLRTERYVYRGRIPDRDDYDKLDVEDVFRERASIVCRLGAIYGEHDYQRREEPVLRRVRAGRRRIPVGNGQWLWTRGYVGDIARGVVLAIERAPRGEVYNLGEERTLTVRAWIEEILAAARSDAKLVRVPDELLPDDLDMAGSPVQPLLFDSSKARVELGWALLDPRRAVLRSVRWHLAHPPADASQDFSADDRALRAKRSRSPDHQ